LKDFATAERPRLFVPEVLKMNLSDEILRDRKDQDLPVEHAVSVGSPILEVEKT
jgi:hypothetical protein